jgi:superfamily II DNA/RNA helicase
LSRPPPLSPGRKTTLRKRARALYDNRIAEEREYEARDYQIKAAVEVVAQAYAGKNCAIELPTGTGKTLIACIAAVLWRSLRPDGRVLLIVPSRTLVVQHFEVARWIATELRIDRISDEQSGDPGALRHTLLTADFVVSTPGVLASAMSRGAVGRDIVNRFDFVIVDEFDQFVVVDEEDHGSVVRYGEHWARLVAVLPKQARYLVKSATLGVAAPQDKKPRTKAEKRAGLIHQQLAPVSITVPEAEYAEVVPLQQVRLTSVEDERVLALLEGVYVAKGKAHLRLDETIGPADYRDVERRAPGLCDSPLGKAVQVRGAGGPPLKFVLAKPAQNRFCAITSLVMMPQHVTEDLTLDLDAKLLPGPVAVKNAENEAVFLHDVHDLIDDRPDGRFRFQEGGKTQALLGIVAARQAQRQRGVIFVRTITLLEGLKPLLAKAGHTLFELTGEMADALRRDSIARFRKSTDGLLLMTRTTGGRGLDLPFAHYGVFYSPKTDAVTMWQEMSRIRSTVSNPKDLHVLCYGGDEAATLQGVADVLQAQNRRVTLVLD